LYFFVIKCFNSCILICYYDYVSFIGLVIFIENVAREHVGCIFDMTEVVVNSSAEILGLVPFNVS